MKLKYTQDWVVYEIAKNLVLCRMKVLPRKTHKYAQIHRWMYPKEWAQFEETLEHTLAQKTAEERKFLGIEDDCEKQFCIDAAISVRIKKLKEHVCQKAFEKDYGKKFDLVIECEFEYIRSKCDSKESLISLVTPVSAEKKSDTSLEQELKKKKKKHVKREAEESYDVDTSAEAVNSKKCSQRIKNKVKNEENQTPSKPNLSKLSGSAKKRRLVDCEKERTLISSWLKTEKSTNGVENDGGKNSKSSKHKSKKLSKISLSKEELQQRALLEKQQLEKNQEMTNMLRGMIKPIPEKFKYLTLEKMSTNELVDSLEDCKNVLDDIFAENNTEKTVHGNDGVDHYLVINLISSQKQLHMMNRLSEEYKCDNATLLANILLPEWLLRIFMQRYKFTRDAAIDQIKTQEEFQIHSNKRKKGDLDLTLQSVKNI